MSLDLAGAIRRRKPERRQAPLIPRPADDLTSVADLPRRSRVALVPDTNVYIYNAAGRLPPEVESLLDTALLFHSTICLAELAVGIASADPSGPEWTQVRDYYVELFAAMPDTRLLTPDAQTWAEAGVIAGTLSRVQGYQPYQRKECLNDALIFLTAARAGLPVLTQNRVDFDLIQQLAPEGQFLHF